MENNYYSHEHLYDDYISSQFDSLKVNTGDNLLMDNNTVTEEGIYSGGMGANPMLNCEYGTTSYDPLNLETSSALQFPQDPELVAMMDSILSDCGDNFPLGDNFQFDVNVAATCIDEEGDTADEFGSPLTLPPYDSQTPLQEEASLALPVVTPEAGRPQRKSGRKAKPRANDGYVDDISFSSLVIDEPQYPDPSELGVPSPASSISSGSDGYGDDTRRKKRRPRVSYSTLTEEEKYKRIRDLNNEASRHYRERQRQVLSTLEHQLPGLVEKNKKLKNKAAGLEALRNQLKQYTDQFLSQHIPNGNNGLSFHNM